MRSMTRLENGFEIFPNSGKDYLVIKQECINECMNYAFEKNYRNLHLSGIYGYGLDNISFVEKYSDFIEGLSINVSQLTTISSIHRLKNLKRLYLNLAERYELDFSKFSKLINLTLVGWSTQHLNIETCYNLETLILSNYHSCTKNLLVLKELKLLRELSLVDADINSLKGIENFQVLENLELHYLKNLTQLEYLDILKNSLKRIYFSNCESIISYQPITKLKKLEKLILEECSSIDDIDFQKHLPKLTHFTHYGTDIKRMT